MSGLFSTRMDYVEELYDSHEGNIHKIMNSYDLDGDDWNYLVELRAWRNGYEID